MSNIIKIAGRDLKVKGSDSREHIALILDESGSMTDLWDPEGWSKGDQTSRRQAVQMAVQQQVLASNEDTTVYSVIAFGTQAQLRNNRSADHLSVYAYEPRDLGGTNFGRALESLLALNANDEFGGVDRAHLLSDGETLTTETQLRTLCTQLKIKEIVVDTTAIGGADDQKLRLIADLTGGTFTRATTTADLTKRFVELETENRLMLTHQA